MLNVFGILEAYPFYPWNVPFPGLKVLFNPSSAYCEVPILWFIPRSDLADSQTHTKGNYIQKSKTGFLHFICLCGYFLAPGRPQKREKTGIGIIPFKQRTSSNFLDVWSE